MQVLGQRLQRISQRSDELALETIWLEKEMA